MEKLLNLSENDLRLMKETESTIIEKSRQAYSDKKASFAKLLNGRDMEDVLLEKMQTVKISRTSKKAEIRLDANAELKDQISEITWDRFPIILMGGSFNTENRATRMTDAAIRQLDELLKFLNPDEVCFVIGHKLGGYEKYLIEHNKKNFRICGCSGTD